MLSDFLKKYDIAPSDTLIVACSGGPDSMYLLMELMKIHERTHIVVAHFNHALRGVESDGDEQFLRDFSIEQGLIFESTKMDIASMAKTMKKGIEETARIERYAFLEGVRDYHKASYILTGHHLDDSIETFIFNLIRGTKLAGLTGIAENNNLILRPLLNISKAQILESLERENTPYRIDSTNSDDTYLRNHLRLNIISEFERINPEYRKNLAAFMEYTKELGVFIDSQVCIFLRGETSFALKDFQALSSFLQREVIRYLYAQANNGTIGLSEGGIAEIIRFIGDKGNYTRKKLGKLHLEKRNFRVYFGSTI